MTAWTCLISFLSSGVDGSSGGRIVFCCRRLGGILIWGVYWCFWRWMLEFFQHVRNKIVYGNVDNFLCVVPVNVETAINFSCPIHGHTVMLFVCLINGWDHPENNIWFQNHPRTNRILFFWWYDTRGQVSVQLESIRVVPNVIWAVQKQDVQLV